MLVNIQVPSHTLAGYTELVLTVIIPAAYTWNFCPLLHKFSKKKIMELIEKGGTIKRGHVYK